MSQNPSDRIIIILQKISDVDASIRAAEVTLSRLNCDGDPIKVTLASVEFPLTLVVTEPGCRSYVTPVEEFNELRQACINAQKNRLFKLRSKAEALRWQLRNEVKSV